MRIADICQIHLDDTLTVMLQRVEMNLYIIYGVKLSLAILRKYCSVLYYRPLMPGLDEYSSYI